MSGDKRVIKKYPNRRLYDTDTSSYITLADVKQLVLDNVDIQVLDAKTGEDITRGVLLQIIMEEESGGMPMFSYDVLTQIIRVYGNTMQGLMGNYLEKNLQLFAEMQGRLQEQASSVMKGGAPVFNPNALWGDLMKMQPQTMQNMMGNYLENSTHLFAEMQQQMQEQAKTLFAGFTPPAQSPAAKPEEAAAAPAESDPAKPRRRKPAA
ncbi:polyhydroxyalkanoate synthesis repressor PhaR [Chitinilyticum piscinae]|uniref:Polyhydroxyalkanoate synthesis repressor PhaR n=1 Tax=Chitinilyticum piscinae TaxID=2866724 RepID=A0A8J7FI12_9NEIS|nr:polyhydroxyalkanoate synthesis repressor PhaR [Chitinilyticum piscinae]MBE9609640.1 polyhydroxyalkanoate synthesis repressor PhaR [Chitinilyticum piscinae]